MKEEFEELDFDAAFDEATAETNEEHKDLEVADAPQVEPETQPEDDDGSEYGEDNTADETEDSEENTETEDEESASESAGDVDELKALLELERERRSRAEQLYRTTEGRFRAYREEHGSKPAKEEKAPKQEDTPIVDSAKLKEFMDDYPEFIDPINELVEKKVKQSVPQADIESLIESRISELKMSAAPQDDPVAQHYMAISTAHPDWESIVNNGDLDLWQAKLPERMRQQMDEIRTQGSAEEVVLMLDMYKRDRGNKLPAATSSQSKRTEAKTGVDVDDLVEKLKSAMAVTSSKTHKPEMKREIDPDDWDAAFEEATKDR